MIFLTTEELKVELAGTRDSLARLQKAELSWKKAERVRGIKTIAHITQRIHDLEADLAMALGRSHAEA